MRTMKQRRYYDDHVSLFASRVRYYICQEQNSDQPFPGVHVAHQKKEMRRYVPIAFRDGVVEQLARKTFAALASQYPSKSDTVLSASLGITEPVLSRWKNDGDLSFSMLAQVLMATARDWTDLKFQDGRHVIDDSEADRFNMAGLRQALESVLERETQVDSVSDAPHELAIACLVLLWRWGPANDRTSIEWVWAPEIWTEPPVSYEGPDPAQNDSDEERHLVREGRLEASSQIQSFLAQELKRSDQSGRSKKIPVERTRRLLADWVQRWGQVAFDTFDIVREFCVEPSPH